MPDFSSELILITCASGKQSTDLVPHVVKNWKNVRLQVNSDESKARLQQAYPDAEVIKADMADLSDCQTMLHGVAACYLVDPPMTAHETSSGYNVIDAAMDQKSKGGPLVHFVFSSVIFPILRKLINHDSKRYIEEYLVESGLPYTIVEPTHMMETFPLAKVLSEENPVYPANWNPATNFSFVTTKDIGEAVANILVQREKHFFATYQLVSTPQPLSYNEVVSIVSEVIGKEIKIHRNSFEDSCNVAVKLLMRGKEPSPATKEIAARMFLYYDSRGLVGNSNILEMLLGRKPTDYRTWVQAKVKEIREQ